MAPHSLDQDHVSFTQWAKSQGVEINGVAPADFPGRRLGMVATREIEEDEIMVTVPLATMLTIDSIPRSFADMFPAGTSIQGVLAAFLMHGDATLLKKWGTWFKVWPPRQNFEYSMPILWPEHLRVSNSKFHESLQTNPTILPPSASGMGNLIRRMPVDMEYETRNLNLLAQQEKRLQHAWKNVLSVFPDTDWDTFSYYWLILNTRSFFYVTPGKKAPEDWNDAIALVPFADYFNHEVDAPCEVDFDGRKYTFKASRRYEKGEEVFMSYGSHSNDFLLVEYGFFLDHNKFDAIYLDEIIFGQLTTAEKEELNSQQFYGNYKVTSASACNRTEVAACMTYMARHRWRDYILGYSTRGMDSRKTASVIRGWIEMYLKESNVTIEILENMLAKRVSTPQRASKAASDEWDKERITMLLGRWNQIKQLCQDALHATS